MRRLRPWTAEDVIAYNLRDGGTAVTVFAEAQSFRVELARLMVRRALAVCAPPAIIAEPGCSAGDISGVFAKEHIAVGWDVVPAAVKLAHRLYPEGVWQNIQAEAIDPLPTDILVLCEFLEHLHDPVSFVAQWLPLAKHVVIGHPLVGDAHDPEEGHVWAYERKDFDEWFPMGGHQLIEDVTFPMGGYTMVMGRGYRP